MPPAAIRLALDFLRLCLWLLIIMMVFVPLERICALHPQKIFRKAFLPDLLLYFLNNLLPKFVLIIPMALVGWTVHRLVPPKFYADVAALPFSIRLAAALFIGEFGFYWGHRWSHAIPFLWNFHSLHHSAEEMDWLVNTHTHPLDMVFTRLCGFVPIYALGLSQPTARSLDFVSIAVIFTSTLWGFFIHANLRWRLGPLEWLIASPAFHHWHHDNDATQPKNFSAMLPCLDILFGTHHKPGTAWPAAYGPGIPAALQAENRRGETSTSPALLSTD
jgi:sterol desaturase/sphingolipid hydroxylase (fatty acid hydroxylase superfamily)